MISNPLEVARYIRVRRHDWICDAESPSKYQTEDSALKTGSS